MTNLTGTPEGQLVRSYRQLASLTIDQLATKLGWSREKLGDIERGTARPRRGDAAREIRPASADLARIAAELGITQGELEEIGRPDAARLLPGLGTSAPVDAALVDRLFDAMATGREAEEFLRFLYGSVDGDGRLRPLSERVQLVVDWIARRDEG